MVSGESPDGAYCFSSFIAVMPSGVAAFPSPSRFAVMFMEIACIAFDSLGIDGNRRRVSGESALARSLVKPERSAIFINPLHRQMLPSRVSINSTACWHSFSAALETSSIVRLNIAKMVERITIPPNSHFIISVITPNLQMKENKVRQNSKHFVFSCEFLPFVYSIFLQNE